MAQWRTWDGIGEHGELYTTDNIIKDIHMMERGLASGKCVTLTVLRRYDLTERQRNRLTRALQNEAAQNSVERINIGDNLFGGAWAVDFANALEKNRMPNLRSLIMRGNNIGDTGATSLAKVLVENKCAPNLSVLNLTENNITAAGAKKLAEAFSADKVDLQSLFISENPIGDEGATALFESFEKLPDLKILYMYTCGIGDAGATSLAVAIEGDSLSRLRDLKLGGNNIGEAGTIRLVEAFDVEGKMPVLRDLDLNNNPIGPAALIRFSEVLENSSLPNLMYLELFETRIDDIAVRRLAEALENGAAPLLEECTVHYNRGVTDSAAEAITSALNILEIRRRLVPARRKLRHHAWGVDWLVSRYKAAKARIEFQPGGPGQKRAGAEFAALAAGQRRRRSRSRSRSPSPSQRGGSAGGGGSDDHRSRVYVGNLASTVSSQDLKDHMRRAGNVTHAEVMRGKDGLCWGIVEFSRARYAQRAISQMHNTEFGGRIIFVRADREAGAGAPLRAAGDQNESKRRITNLQQAMVHFKPF